MLSNRRVFIDLFFVKNPRPFSSDEVMLYFDKRKFKTSKRGSPILV
eukprot:UN22820